MGENTTGGKIVIGLCYLGLIALFLYACFPEFFTLLGALFGL
jgi:hypothetical protein